MTVRGWTVNFEAGLACRWGGHGESLRRNRGDAAGAKLGTKLIDRFAVNTGTCDTMAHEMSECIEEVRLMPEV